MTRSQSSVQHSQRRRLLVRAAQATASLLSRHGVVGQSLRAAGEYAWGPPKSEDHKVGRRAVIGAVLVGSGAVLARQISQLGRKRRARQVRALQSPPYRIDPRFFDFKSEEVDCAKYIRVVDEVFGIKYQQADAWNFANVNVKIWDRQSSSERFPEEKLRAGMVVGLYHPDSDYLKHLEQPGANPYTHLAMVVGFAERNGKNEPCIAHFFGKRVRFDFLNDFVAADEGEIRAIIGPSWGMSKLK